MEGGLWSPLQNLSSPAFPLLESFSCLLLHLLLLLLLSETNVVVLPLWTWTWTPQRGTRSVLPSPSLRFASTFTLFNFMSLLGVVNNFLSLLLLCMPLFTTLFLLHFRFNPLSILAKYILFVCSSHGPSSFRGKVSLFRSKSCQLFHFSRSLFNFNFRGRFFSLFYYFILFFFGLKTFC